MTDGPVAHVRIDNPTARGAMTLGMMRDLADAVIELQRFEGSLVVVSSTDPRAFCSGGHLKEVAQVVSAGGPAKQMSWAMTAVLDGLLALPVPSVAALQGVALGGGAELAVACDWRVAAPDARIHFVHAGLGIAPGWGGAARLVHLLGRSKALRILTAGRSVTRGEANLMGLVDHGCDGDATEAALAWCSDLLGHSSEAVRAIKAQVAAGGLVRADDRETQLFSEVWGAEAHRDALTGLERHRR